MSIIAQIEDAIINRIKTAAGLGYVLQYVESYGGQLDDDTFETVRSLPAVWVTFAGCDKPKQRGENLFLADAHFVLIMGARNIRGEREGRVGSIGEVGVYQMIDDMGKLLMMQDLGLPIDHFRPGRIRTLYNQKLQNNGLAVFTQEWHTKIQLSPASPQEDDWLRMGLNYMLKPGDGVADASDQITLSP